MSKLAPTFHTRDRYAEGESYSLLPFDFLRLDQSRTVLTNLAGEHAVIPSDLLTDLIEKRIPFNHPRFVEFEAKHLIVRGARDAHLELLAAQIRTRRSLFPDFTALHIFVVTLRCDHSCQYCQVSRVSEDRAAFDMSDATADKAVDLMLQSPSPRLKVEFQGGESLLNLPLIRRIVARVKEKAADQEVSFVAATNLSTLTEDMLDFFSEHQIFVSTSIDGPEQLHNLNRPRPGRNAYERTVAGIKQCRERLGPDSVSALMTCSAASLEMPEAIIDEYVRLGFHEIFLRHISPYGFAVRAADRVSYETERFLDFYRRGLAHILKLNRDGVTIRETYASLLLRRMLTCMPTGYVDLQSPTGSGLAAIVYNYDGDVYSADEGRMLAEMGDKTFRIGSVHTNTWKELYLESEVLTVAEQTMSEGTPGCSDCAFREWCGTDPVFHHATQKDVVGHRPTSAFCRRNMEIMRHLVTLLEDDPEAAPILRSWAR